MYTPLVRQDGEGADVSETISAERIIAVANASLEIVLAEASFGEIVGEDGVLIGRNLRDLLQKKTPSTGRLFDLLLRRVAGEVTVGTVGETDRLVATLTSPETRSSAPWVLLTVRPFTPIEAPGRWARPFVGRQEHLDAFERFLLAPDDVALVVEGPIGIGKSATLGVFEARCRELACPVFTVDARTTSLDGGALDALTTSVDGGSLTLALLRHARAGPGRRWVLLIDDFDAYGRRAGLGGRDPLRGLPEGCRVVVATRSRSAALESIGLRYRTFFCRLGPLSPAEASLLATRLEIGDHALLGRADGHPLAIQALAHGPTIDGDAVDRLLLGGDLAISRDLLEVASIPPRITEDVLFAVLDDEALATKTYDALGALCYPDREDLGLRMPDVFRRALATQLRRRNPARHGSLRLRLARHYLHRLEDADALHAPSTLDDLIATFDDDSPLGEMFGARSSLLAVRRLPAEAGNVLRPFLERAHAADTEGILGRLEEGVATYVIEGDARQDEAFLGLMQFAIVTQAEPVMQADRHRALVRSMVQRFAVGGECRIAALLSFVVPEPGWGPVAQALGRQYLKLLVGSRRLAALVSVSDEDPSRFGLGFPGSELVEIDDVKLRVRDLRQIPVGELLLAFLQQTSEDEWDPPDVRSSLPPAIPPEAVRLALASLDQPTVLRASALAWLVADGDPKRLRGLLTDAIETLRTGEDMRQHEILKAVYLDKRGKHELIASELAMPYSTFRRHLARGIERVRELLTERASSSTLGIPGV